MREERSLKSRLRGVSCLSTSRHTTMPSSSLGAMSSVFWVGLWKRARQRDKRMGKKKKRETRTEDGAERARTRLILFLASPPCCSVAVSASWGLRLRLLWFVLAPVSVAMGTLKSRTSLSSLVVEEAVSMQH